MRPAIDDVSDPSFTEIGEHDLGHDSDTKEVRLSLRSKVGE
jgi:hypothetical protein